MPSAIDALKARFFDINALTTAITVLDWDQQCFMPSGGAEGRSEHVGTLSRMAHEMSVSDETRKLLEAARAEVGTGDTVEAALVRVAQRDFDLQTKIPASLVEEKSKLAAVGHEKWVQARANNDFKSFAPILERMFEIARQEAEFLGYKEHIYDALLDQYEEGATAADCRRMFEALKGPNVKLVREIKERGPVDDSRLTGEWDIAKQKEFTEGLVKAIGFDMTRGRQDTAPHPFCTTFGIGDVRLTTRFKPYLPSAIFGSMHEAGHGVYEQGSPMDWDRTPLAGGVSLGVHESQSRTWENVVGRSYAFWKRFLPDLQKLFPTLSGVSLDDWYRMVNKVEPSLIRVEADEVTYNLHILVRFELECDILTGALKVSDLPAAWNAKYKEYLGIEPDSDSNGCLQDVHWSGGAIGYFPTYSMGNLLSYQFWNKLRADLGDTDALIEGGKFEPILGWLRENIYRHGRRYAPKDLVMRVTGKPMGAEDYLAGLEAKYRAIYS